MRIICPNCEYAQDIPEAKIPPRSVLATCPKCGEKFKFRDIDPALPAEVRPPEQAAQEQAAPQPSPEPSPDPQTPQAQAAPPAPPSAPPLVAEPGSARPQGDVWERLEDLAGDGTHGRGHAYDRPGGPGGPGDPDGRDTPPPWERLDEFGFFPGLTATIKQVMLAPRELFASMPVTRGMAKPLIFYLLVSEFAALCQFVWQMMGMDLLMRMADQGVTPEQTMITGAGLLAYLVVYPLLLAGGLFVTSGVMHLMLMIMRAAHGGFEGTFRVVAYSAAPIVLSVIPLLGSLIGALWSLWLLLVGLRWVHRASYTRILIGLHLPLLVIIPLAVLMALAMHSGGM